MIARIVIPLILVILLSDLYIDQHYFRSHYRLPWWGRLLWWLPCLVILVYTIVLASMDNFAPQDQRWLEVYLLLLGLLTGPKAIFALCSSLGWIVRKTILPTRHNYGHYLGLALSAVAVVTYVYGLTIGFSQIRVKHVDLTFRDLPPSFDGYRIMHLSDLHVGTFQGFRHKILEAELDSIANQKADLVVFTGDLQNMHPSEVEREMATLRRLPHLIMILGNHDYAKYVKAEGREARQIEQRLVHDASKLGRVLRNEAMVITSPQGEELWIVGEENYGKPTRRNSEKAMKDVPENAFVIYLQHNPQAWRTYILPHTKAQLTLSGHTHGGQMQIMGFRPTMLSCKEDYGLHEEAGRYIYVTAGLGGLVPFRLNMPNEVTIITLHRAKNQ